MGRFGRLGLAMLLVTLAGCAAHRGGSGPGTRQPPPLDESFDVLSLGVEQLPLPEQPVPSGGRDTSFVSAVESTRVDTSAAEEMVPGYRVQVCATPDEATARAYYHDALMKFLDQGVYLRFDSPYYKVRIGDCKSRFEAEELQKRVQKAGFPDAWVVRTRVYANPDLRRREDREPPAQP